MVKAKDLKQTIITMMLMFGRNVKVKEVLNKIHR